MKQINTAVIGLGNRGIGNIKTILTIPGVKIAAVSDAYEDRCDNASKIIVEKGFDEPFKTCDYREILARGDIEAVMIFTGWEMHVKLAVEAMKAKKSVGIEVGGAYSLDECFELVRTYEETKTPIMFLENCCYGKNEMLIRNIVRDGLFGELVHCHGAYGHDIRGEVTTGKEKRHYRLNNYINRNCENYPTHELGPIAKVLDINRGNRMVSLVSVASKAAGIKQYVQDRADAIENKDLLTTEFKQGDIVNTIITCANGETISLRLDTTLPRPYSREFTVRGTKGMYEENTNSIFLDGDKEDFETAKHYKEVFDNAKNYEEKYLPECWRSITQEEIELGHGGMDHFVFSAFFDAVRNGTPMPIDVYDAASWMCITPLSEESIAKGAACVQIPDFTNGAWKTRERLDV